MVAKKGKAKPSAFKFKPRMMFVSELLCDACRNANECHAEPPCSLYEEMEEYFEEV